MWCGYVPGTFDNYLMKEIVIGDPSDNRRDSPVLWSGLRRNAEVEYSPSRFYHFVNQ